jgi:hypothetical protein
MRRLKDPDDPSRCRATASDGGQCWNESAGNSEYCEVHGGRENSNAARLDYLTEQFERRLKLSENGVDEVMLLRENLMKLNMMLAARYNLIKDESSLMAQSPAIYKLLAQAEKLTVSLNRLAIVTGQLLERAALETWAQNMVHAVAKMVEDKYAGWQEDILALTNEVATITADTRNVEESK